MPPPTHFRWVDGDLLVQLRISPRASREQVGGVVGERLKVALTAAPVEGKANQQLVKLVAKRFAVPPSRVAVVRGATGRDKTVRIQSPGRLPAEFRITPQPP